MNREDVTDEIHIIPNVDTIEHDMSGFCVCEPSVEFRGKHMQTYWIHKCLIDVSH